MMDIIFGRNNFKNEIIWNSDTGAKNNTTKRFGRAHDTIFFYAGAKAKFNMQYTELDEDYIETWYTMQDENGRRYMARPLNRRPRYEYEFLGETRLWDCPPNVMEDYLAQGRITHETTTPGSKRKVARYKFYLDESPGKPAQDNWTEVPSLSDYSEEKTGYPTQKPVALLERIINASSDEGDIVLDPFCGCATTLVAAERLNRRWIGIDVEPESVNQLRERLRSELNLFGVDIHRKDFPERTDIQMLKPPKNIKEILYQVQRWRYNGCERHIPFELKDFFDLDHITPRSRGGRNTEKNLQLLCRTCNVKKGAGSMKELKAKLELERAQSQLVNP